MCGIIGYWTQSGEISENVISKMAGTFRHRGPDSDGQWSDSSAGIALGHLRLAIVDLSPSGHQPMASACGRYILSYNGEIYNHNALRSLLQNQGAERTWAGHSDTEVFLAAIENWGLDKTLGALEGMFAFALWDRKLRRLVLGRDRMGEKPLYYGGRGKTLLFGSDIGAFREHPDFTPEIDREALTLYIRHNYVPEPWSIYKGVKKLRPGHYLTFASPEAEPQETCYWRLQDHATAEKLSGTPEELTDAFDSHLKRAISQQMVADVPVGAFLSGGYDSSLVTAVMQSQSSRPVKTFTIGFREDGYNEAVHAKAVAKHLGTDHTELYVTPDQALDVIPQIPRYWTEPFADSSQIPTFLVSALAKQQVTVSLSGDGGDELFSGYARYRMAERIWSKLGRIPYPLNKFGAAAIDILPGELMEAGQKLLPQGLQVAHLADRLPKLAQLLRHSNSMQFYKGLMSTQQSPGDIVLGGSDPETVYDTSNSLVKEIGLSETMGVIDALSYLPADILAKVDRASMAHSLESRVPMLDHRIVEFAFQVPMSLKHRDGRSKWLLKTLAHRYIPKDIMERPKMGFGVPISDWLRGPLREWGEDLLSEDKLRDDGFFNAPTVRQLWDEHQSGKRRWHAQLWGILMFQAWHEGAKQC